MYFYVCNYGHLGRIDKQETIKKQKGETEWSSSQPGEMMDDITVFLLKDKENLCSQCVSYVSLGMAIALRRALSPHVFIINNDPIPLLTTFHSLSLPPCLSSLWRLLLCVSR